MTIARLLAGAAASVVTAAALYVLARPWSKRRQPGTSRVGPKATEGLAQPGDDDYDAKMVELWGGPPPKHFPAALEEWPAKYGGDRIRGKLALVTGSTGGIGFYVAKLLAALGCTVIVPCRPGLEEEAAGTMRAIAREVPGARVVVPEAKLDLSSLASVRSFAAAMRRQYERLDFLCLNAGRGGSRGDPRQETEDGLESILQVNVLGHFLLTAELMPLLVQVEGASSGGAGGHAAGPSRVVSQTSGARLQCSPCSLPPDWLGRDRPSDFDTYRLSKALNCFFSQGLNEHLARAGASGECISLTCDPGFASTGVNIQHNLGHSMLNLPDGLLSTETMHRMGQHAADGALPMVLACVDPDARPGDWFHPAKELAGPAARGDPAAHRKARQDPLNVAGGDWPAPETRERFWEGATAATGAAWLPGGRLGRGERSAKL